MTSKWLGPALVVVVAFCAGVQLSLLFQLLSGTYLASALPLQAVTFAAMAAGIYYLRPSAEFAALRARLQELSSRPESAKAQAPAPPPVAAPPPMPKAAPLPQPRPQVRVDLALETPLARGPVWPPGEPIPITIQVKSNGALDDIDVELELQHAGGTERARVPLRGNTAVLSQTVPTPGPFVITARALRDGRPAAEASVRGRAASYREEIGQRFDALKEAMARSFSVGEDATPRDVRDALAKRYPAMQRTLDELLASLEIALYGQDEVGRESYEALVRALAELQRRGVEAKAHA